VRYVVVMMLCFCSVMLHASKPATVETLEVFQGNNIKEIQLSTMNIPEHADVVVRCEISVPLQHRSHFNVYVMPRVGNFGLIEERNYYTDTKTLEIVTIGSKIYTNVSDAETGSNVTYFYITQVKQSNEAIVMDMRNLPDEATVVCTF
jgi:hypothetical protein